MEGRLGKYELLDRLAIGGMAELFLARSTADHGFEKTVVLKRILPSFAEQHDFVQMFLNEARLAAGLHHPNIAQVFDFGQDKGEYFFTMEYVAGRNLRQLAAAARRTGHPLHLGSALYIIENVAAGLHHAHEHRDAEGKPLQIVHRDVSPSNVIVTYEGHVKLVDFGVAKIAALGPSTLAGSIKGKVSYMSPEQCRGELVDRRSDLFSLGILLWELTTGRKLFGSGDKGMALLKRVEQAAVPRPTSIVENYPPELERIVLKALARDRNDRFATARDFRLAIEDFGYRHRVPLTSTRLSAYMDRLFPIPERATKSVMTALPLVRAMVPPPEAEPEPKTQPEPEPKTQQRVRVAPHPPAKPAAPRKTPPAAAPKAPIEDSDDSKTLVADGPAEETSPGVAKAERAGATGTRNDNPESRPLLLWAGAAVIGAGLLGGAAWRFGMQPEPAANRSAPVSAEPNAAAKPEPPPRPADPKPPPEPQPAADLPTTLEGLQALSFAERHAGLASASGPIAVELHLGLDLLQAKESEDPCRTFADALSTIEASDDPRAFSWAIDDATAPEGSAPMCKGLKRRLEALRSDDDDVRPAKRQGRTRKRPRPAGRDPAPQPETPAPEPVAEPQPEPEAPKAGVATKLDEDLRGLSD